MPRSDFNGDGRDDVLWLNTQSGVSTNWLGQADGGLIYNSDSDSDPYAPGQFAAFGDFDGDGRSDTLWRQDNGEVFINFTSLGGTFYFQWNAGFVARVPTDWSIVGTGNFDGDGRDDVLWRHANGTVTDWLGQANGGFSNNHSNTGQIIPTDWQIVGTGDFNGDGRDDILWRNANGTLTDWLGQANGGFINNDLASRQFMETKWSVVGTGDYNGDGRDDILWRHVDGTLTNWLGGADGSFASNAAHAYYPVDPVWQVQPFSASGAGSWDY